MNDNHNGSPIGDQIKDALTEALQSGDFRNLNELVVQTVTDTLSEVGVQIAQETTSAWKAGKDGWQFGQQEQSGQEQHRQEQRQHKQEQMQREEQRRQEQIKRQQDQMQREEQRRQEQRQRRQEQMQREEQRRQEQRQRKQEQMQREEQRRQEQIKRQQEQFTQEKARQQNAIAQQRYADPSLVKFKRVGGVSNLFGQLFGGLGFFFFLVMGSVTLVTGTVTMQSVTEIAEAAMSAACLALPFGWFFLQGSRKEKRLKRAERYIQLCDYRMYGNIKDLAAATGKSEDYVRKDIQKMLDVGMFPEGHLDKQGTCFMLNDVVYGQYLELERNHILVETENENGKTQKKDQETQNAAVQGTGTMESEQEAELNTMVAEGMECVRKLRDLNDKIPGEVISDKLYRLENLLKEIFDSVRIHPEQMHRMHKLMNYYLPTTLKLVEAYEEFDRVSAPGREILDAKSEIENTLDTINQAFKELLNNLFQSAVFDVTTDAQVLKTMLAKEGLTRDGLTREGPARELEFVRRS